MSAARLITSFRAPLAAFLAALVLLVTGLVHLPELHRALHPSLPGPEHCASHGNTRDTTYPLSSDDLCVVALFSQGLDAPWQAALVALPACINQESAPVCDTAPALASPTWQHPPAQAPPASAHAFA
jgi:hypothetical protein